MNQENSWALSNSCINFIIKNTLRGAPVLELGGGASTKIFAPIFTLFSIEQDKNIYDDLVPIIGVGKIFFAPLKNNWYDLTKVTLPDRLSTIIIDGPKGPLYRHLFMDNLDKFDLSALIIIDDVGRKHEFELFNSLLTLLRRPGKIIREQYKSWGYINRV